MGRMKLAGIAGIALAAALGFAAALNAQETTGPSSPAPGVRMGLSSAGGRLFSENCGLCHAPESGIATDSRAPAMETLRQYPPERIYAALTEGLMRAQGAELTDPQRREIAEWLAARSMGAGETGDAASMKNRCASDRFELRRGGWNGWSADSGNRREQTTARGGLVAADVANLKLKWAFGLPGGAQVFSQPAVVDGWVFIGSDSGQVYAIDAETGCTHWSFLADGAVRTAPIVAPTPAGPAVYVGDLKANVYALDASTGRLLWKVRADDQPLSRITGAPSVSAGRLFVPVSTNEEGQARMPGMECCRHRGSIVALNTTTGEQLWKTYMQAEPTLRAPDPKTGRRLWGPAGGAVWSSPTADARRGLLYVATGNGYAGPAGPLTDAVVALRLDTGQVAWAHQETAGDVWLVGCDAGGYGCPTPNGPDVDFASSPMLVHLGDGRDIVVAAHKGGVALGLDPDRAGELIWRAPMATAPVSNKGDVLFGGAADAGTVLFGLQLSGSVTALDPLTGAKKWVRPLDAKAGWAGAVGPGAALSTIPGVVFVPGWDGALRALSTADGRQLWSFDTVREYETVNGVGAKGGSMGAPGAVVAEGMVFVGSGYVGTGNGMPGNALLAFGVQQNQRPD